jgi:acetylornithine/succinyldiaminopimelate/putrescine aminotransferase
MESVSIESVPTPASTGNSARPLITLDAAYSMPLAQSLELYADYLNPGLLRNFQILGLDRLDLVRAKGCFLYGTDGTAYLDFSSALGIAALGHNHPRIVSAQKRFLDEDRISAYKLGPHRLQGALAYNLASLMPKELSHSFFAVSGAEAVEAALKLCERANGQGTKPLLVSTQGSYHGRTHGTMPVTRTPGFQDGFVMGIPPETILEIPFGDAEALEAVLIKNAGKVFAFIVEPIQGQNVLVADPSYLKKARALCTRHGVLLICDEVKMGLGRTGRFCGFEHAEIVPDVVTLSKSLGGGASAISAMITTPEVFKRAYGTRATSALHGTTFGGLGISCALAIEALCVLKDDKLVQAAAEKGRVLRALLEKLQERFPRAIRAVRGEGLFMGLEFHYDRPFYLDLLKKLMPPTESLVDSVFIASVVRELAVNEKLLVHFSASHPQILHLMPPLVVSTQELTQAVDSIGRALEKGFSAMVHEFVAQQFKALLPGGKA